MTVLVEFPVFNCTQKDIAGEEKARAMTMMTMVMVMMVMTMMTTMIGKFGNVDE